MNVPLNRRSIPILLLLVFAGVAFVLINNPPAQQSRPHSDALQMSVSTQVLTARDYPISIASYGTVRPRTQSLLVAQVAGQVLTVADNFDNGGFFKQGDVLLLIDDRDYQADVKIAQAALMDAEQMLAEEQARSELALKDWQSLGRKDVANDYLLRKPQLIAAQARIISAESSLLKAQLNLERTKITAPYDGRVMSSNVDLGQVVGANAVLGEIYASDKLELRLPIRNRDLKYVDLPEVYKDANQPRVAFPVVDIFSSLVKDQVWRGLVVRTESAIDTESRQLHVVAEINEPFLLNKEQAQIKIGQYVTAKIAGKILSNSIVIPASSIYQSSFVYIVERPASNAEKNISLLQRKPITIAWQNDSDAVVESGLEVGDELVLSPLGQVSSGTQVNIIPPVQTLTTVPAAPALKQQATSDD